MACFYHLPIGAAEEGPSFPVQDYSNELICGIDKERTMHKKQTKSLFCQEILGECLFFDVW